VRKMTALMTIGSLELASPRHYLGVALQNKRRFTPEAWITGTDSRQSRVNFL